VDQAGGSTMNHGNMDRRLAEAGRRGGNGSSEADGEEQWHFWCSMTACFDVEERELGG
jgi:hypothetical protein